MLLFGRPVAPDVAAVRRRLAEHRTPPEQQSALWLDLWRQWPDPVWGEQCLAEAERVDRLVRRARSLALSPAVATPAGQPLAPPSPASVPRRHYVWLGDRLGIRADHLRDGIARLAAAGMIGSDRAQQDALRRGLGLAVNDTERASDAPWVVWLGPTDMLWLLIDGLWQLELITCAGGRQQKWATACALFLRPDGTLYDHTLRNSRCTNPEKVAVMERALLGGLRFLVAAG